MLNISDRLQFFLERQFVKGPHYQLLFVILFIGLISLGGGLLVWPVAQPKLSLAESIWWAFLRLTDPGYLGDDQGLWQRLISTILTIAGYVLFLGSLVAIITAWLNQRIRVLEQGLTPVNAQNHLVILGWTNRTSAISAELFQAAGRLRKFLRRQKSRSLKLIILADDVTPDRLQELRDHPFIGRRARQVILRSGVAIDREHLRRVDAWRASAIILPSQTYTHRPLITPQMETIKALLTLQAEARIKDINPLPYVVAEIQDQNKVKAAYRAYHGPLEVISSDTLISRLLAQNIRHPGLSSIFNQLLTHTMQNNIYITDHPQLAGLSFAQLRPYFPQAIVLGAVHRQEEDYQAFLNPGSEVLFTEAHKLVLLAPNLASTAAADARELAPTEDLEVGEAIALPQLRSSLQTLILGWNHHVPALIQELDSYQDQDYQITVASLRPVAEREQELKYSTGTPAGNSCQHVLADYAQEKQLRALKPRQYDRIVLVSSDRYLQDEEADARTIVGYTLLEEVLGTRKPRPQVIMELVDPSNEPLIQSFSCESLIPPQILSNILASIALRRELHSVYQELFSEGGAEIIFRAPEEYDLQGQEVSFAALERKAQYHREIALGVFRKPQGKEAPRATLVPERQAVFTLDEASYLVVITSLSTSNPQENTDE